ncbi:MAG: metal-dependent transcriptional regulator [Gemmatimonadota bacterium]
MPSTAISTSTGDYLKAIYQLGDSDAWVSSSALAQHLGVSAPAATGMTQRLAEQGYATYVPYRGVRLTDRGRDAALELLRHHRLLELYLERALGYSWDRVHDEAEKLEHTISEELEDRIDAALGHPTEDPHGHPIPPKSGLYREEPVQSLWAARGEELVVRRVSDRDPEVLRYLDAIGVRPGVGLRVVRRAPFDGPLTIVIQEPAGAPEHALGERLARQIFVAPTHPEPRS